MDVLVIDSDTESDAESSDSEYQDNSESVYGGHAQSILSSLDDSIGKIDDFLAFERGFVHGDFVCSITDPSGQLGRVVDVDMIVDLETSSGDLIKDVNSKKLHRVRTFMCGDYVVKGPWVGRVERVFDVVTVVFGDGAKCEILIKDTEALQPVPSRLLEDSPYFYFPGQHVRINVPTIFKSMRWLCGSWKARRDEGTVQHVEIGLVHINWISSVASGQRICSSSPSHFQEPKNLTLLSCFSYANWQLGDWCTVPVDYFHIDSTNSATLNTAPKNCTKMEKGLGMYGKGCRQTYVIARTKSMVDVLWQNGTLSVGIDPHTLFPVNNLSDHDFWPEQFVLEKVISDDMCFQNCQRLGVVKKVDALERTVKVKWIVPDFKQTARFVGESIEETVSAYELIEHPDFSFCIGDVVLRFVSSIENMDEKFPVANFTGKREQHDMLLDTSNSHLVKDAVHKTNTNESCDEAFSDYLSYIGNVIGYKNEGVEIRWGNGLITTVSPSEIFGLDRLLDTASIPLANEETIPANAAIDMADQEEQLGHKNTEVVDDSCEDSARDVWKATTSLFSKGALQFLTYVAASLFGALDMASLSGLARGDSEFQILKAEEMHLDVENLEPECLEQQKEQTEQSEEPTSSTENDKTMKFKQFDTVDEYSDHHFVNDWDNRSTISQVKRSWLKKIQQEWSILEKDLPESIFVRVYEERMDLLRACIVGAAGTPYHDGLFFFDILFPPDYPHEPPLVHYNSGGLQLNPNLYESGKVCLSLLKTWTGTGTEVWNPESSTILQVLLSLQALVLNEKPYFNEAGYDKQLGRAEGEKNSVTYNENAFLLSCKSMLYLLHKPPKHFEKLVHEHFTCRSSHILLACKAYLDGTQVGQAYDCGKVKDEGQKSCSTGFKIMLAKLLPNLISAFTEMGIDCSQFLHQVNEATTHPANYLL
ncbi:probable ubiquitin-conjugating enzyme E2 24 [Typha latifolia]|uniref:probable ubiquitin-conjugating enzyme E2 24 n=1 Tax=Typha latifolia TaxID=4733 RepID=UPI003C2F7491